MRTMTPVQSTMYQIFRMEKAVMADNMRSQTVRRQHKTDAFVKAKYAGKLSDDERHALAYLDMVSFSAYVDMKNATLSQAIRSYHLAMMYLKGRPYWQCEHNPKLRPNWTVVESLVVDVCCNTDDAVAVSAFRQDFARWTDPSWNEQQRNAGSPAIAHVPV